MSNLPWEHLSVPQADLENNAGKNRRKNSEIKNRAKKYGHYLNCVFCEKKEFPLYLLHKEDLRTLGGYYL